MILALSLACGGYVVGGGRLPDAIESRLWGRAPEAIAAELPAGYVLVPQSVSAIEAYTKLAREHLFDAKNVRWQETAQRKEALPADVILDRKKILGRVLERDKPAGYVFTERDFLPEGTRPGLVAGIPAGKRGYRVELDRIPGLYGLEAGDRFDLVATIASDEDAEKELSKVSGAYADAMVLDAKLNSSLKQAKVRVVVQNGVVVEPVTIRQIPYSASSLTQGTKYRTRPVQEAFLAIAPDEVATLEEALAVEARIQCVPRSGRPDDPVDSRTPDLDVRSPLSNLAPGSTDPGSGLRFVETIREGKRSVVPVPARGEGK